MRQCRPAKNFLEAFGSPPHFPLCPGHALPGQLEPARRAHDEAGGIAGDFIEPREAVVDDVTGDGKNDLIIIVHDRILVYPQE